MITRCFCVSLRTAVSIRIIERPAPVDGSQTLLQVCEVLQRGYTH